MAEEWKLQVSYKTPSGDMINVRAQTVDELSVLLEGIGDYSHQVASVQRLIVGAYGALPLATSPSTQGTAPSTSSAPPHPLWLQQRHHRVDRRANMALASTSRESPARRETLTRCGSVRCLRARTSASQSTRARPISILN
jgi:hypothetical protein